MTAQQNARAATVTDGDLLHTGPGTVAGRYMRRFWQPVQRSEDLPVGHARPVKILGQDFTLYRGESGRAQAVGFRCAHRGARLSLGFVEGDALRCFYHGWQFAPSGACLERPAEKTPPSDRHRIPSYPTEEYLGLVFVYLGDGPPPPLPRFPSMEQDGVREVTVDILPCNFFFSLENDTLHFAFTHRDLLAAKNLSGVPEVWAEESAFGITNYAKWPNRKSVGVAQKGMPNIGYIVPTAILLAKGTAHALHTSWRVPIDDESHVTYRVNLTTVTGAEAQRLVDSRPPSYYDRSSIRALGDAVLAGKIRLQDIEDRTHIEFIQDYVVQVGQGPIDTRADENLASSDSVVVLLRKIWRREIQAMLTGGRMKEWRLDPALEPATML